jgi:hypothetical protein
MAGAWLVVKRALYAWGKGCTRRENSDGKVGRKACKCSEHASPPTTIGDPMVVVATGVSASERHREQEGVRGRGRGREGGELYPSVTEHIHQS